MTDDISAHAFERHAVRLNPSSTPSRPRYDCTLCGLFLNKEAYVVKLHLDSSKQSVASFYIGLYSHIVTIASMYFEMYAENTSTFIVPKTRTRWSR